MFTNWSLVLNDVQFSTVQSLSCVWLFVSLRLQHSRLPCPSPTPGVYSNSCPSNRWCHPAISSSVFPFSSCPQFLPASESFPMSQPFTWGGQSIGVSASALVLPMNTQDWSPFKYIIYINLLKRLLLVLWPRECLTQGPGSQSFER